MFGLMLKSTHDAVVKDLQRERDEETRRANFIGEALNETLQERDAARAEVDRLTQLRKSGNGNLQRGSKPKAANGEARV